MFLIILLDSCRLLPQKSRCCSRSDGGTGGGGFRGGDSVCGHEEPVCKRSQGGFRCQGGEEEQNDTHEGIRRESGAEQDGNVSQSSTGSDLITGLNSSLSRRRWRSGWSSEGKWTQTVWRIPRSSSSSPVDRQSGRDRLSLCTAPWQGGPSPRLPGETPSKHSGDPFL